MRPQFYPTAPTAINQVIAPDIDAEGVYRFKTRVLTPDDQVLSTDQGVYSYDEAIPFARHLNRTTLTENNWLTYSAEVLRGGIIYRDCSGDPRTDTMPSADQVLAVIPNAIINDGLQFRIKNVSDAGEVLSFGCPIGVSWQGGDTADLAAGEVGLYFFRLTDVTPGSATGIVEVLSISSF